MMLKEKGQILLILVVAAAGSVTAKRLAIFGDSVSDNGNGTNPLVKATFEKLGFNSPPDYPPERQYQTGRWSNGPTWPDYLIARLNGYELYDRAVGGSTIRPTINNVGDFYPNNLQSNKLGRTPTVLPGLKGQIDKYFADTGPAAADDVFVVESGNNDITAAVTGNFSGIVNFAKNAALDAPLEDAIERIRAGVEEALETIYAKGGRKFLVWGLVAIEQVPIVQTVNKYVNVLDQFFTHTHKDTTTQYGLKVSVAADAAIQAAISNFTAAHAVDPPLVQFFDLAGLQRSFKKEALGLGFIDTVNGCVTGMVLTDYATSNQENLGTLVTTFPGAAATLTLSHDDMLRDKLNLDAYIIETLFGPVLKARPNNTVDFLGRFSENIFHLERNSTKSNKLGHVLGAALTSLPIGEGGVNPYNFVPSCITNAGSHLYHDEVHPTTKQHQLISDAFYKQVQGAFFS